MMEKCRQWLKQNKIFFETITASFLTFMAIIISVVQINISCQQKKLSTIQTEIAREQVGREKKLTAIQQSADWTDLRDTMWAIMAQFPARGSQELNNLSVDQKLAWLQKIESLLSSHSKNPVLIGNRNCLGRWRNAIVSAKTSVALVRVKPDQCVIAANSILKDISYVWRTLVLDSEEVSATGGRPEETK